MACFHHRSVVMPEPTQPGRARVWDWDRRGETTADARRRQANESVREWRRGVGMIIASVNEMLREFASGWMESFL
jgi:hypothetical protein